MAEPESEPSETKRGPPSPVPQPEETQIEVKPASGQESPKCPASDDDTEPKPKVPQPSSVDEHEQTPIDDSTEGLTDEGGSLPPSRSGGDISRDELSDISTDEPTSPLRSTGDSQTTLERHRLIGLQQQMQAKEVVKLLNDTYLRGQRAVARIFDPQTRGMSTQEKLEFYQLKKETLEQSSDMVDKFVKLCLGKEIRECEKEVKETAVVIENALRAGYVAMTNNNVLVVGAAGTGKTCTKHMIFSLDPPERRDSTALGEPPKRVLRDISRQRLQKDCENWKAIENEELKQIVVETVSEVGRMVTNISTDVMAQFQDIVAATTRLDQPAARDTAAVEAVIDPTALESPSSPISPGPGPVDVCDSFIACVEGSMRNNRRSPPADMGNATRVLGKDWIYFIDSGGQPHFHNLLPHFIQGISTILLVFRLCDRLDDRPSAEMYENDVLIGSCESTLTIEETLKYLIRSMQSLANNGENKPKLIFIGTFLDKIDECSETLPEKNAKLIDLFIEECREQIIYSNKEMNEVIFPITATSRGEQEKQIARLIRSEIEEAAVVPINIPIWWYVLEVMLRNLAVHLDRMVFSKQECLDVAMTLNLGEEELVTALKFLHKMHIFHYYPESLPDVVFTSPQVLLYKLTELVKEAYRLRAPSTSLAESLQPQIGGNFQFRERGCITYGFLSQDKFQEHYVEGVFTAKELLKIFNKLLIVTPYSVKSSDKISYTKDKFYMPSLLNMLSTAEVEKHRRFRPIQPLVILFPTGAARSGVFCCLQVFLIQKRGWRLSEKDGKPDVIAQNCVMLSHPELPCTITLIDSFSYFEVYVKSATTDFDRELPLIREEILDGIQTAEQVLNYEKEEKPPQKAFFCPCNKTDVSPQPGLGGACLQEASTLGPERHIAWLRGKHLCCSHENQKYSEVTKKHAPWLKTQSVHISSSDPRLDVDTHLWNVASAIEPAKAKWLNIGRALHVSHGQLDSIGGRYSNNDTERLMQVLTLWMQSGEATTNQLLEALENNLIGCKDLANQIRAYDTQKKLSIGLCNE